MSDIYLQFNKEDFVKQPDGSYEYKSNKGITAIVKPSVNNLEIQVTGNQSNHVILPEPKDNHVT
tara:strand:+ start:1743 stop:1934 length:192 start_codon:yes stop_codon:yes gene_type:complete